MTTWTWIAVPLPGLHVLSVCSNSSIPSHIVASVSCRLACCLRRHHRVGPGDTNEDEPMRFLIVRPTRCLILGNKQRRGDWGSSACYMVIWGKAPGRQQASNSQIGILILAFRHILQTRSLVASCIFCSTHVRNFRDVCYSTCMCIHDWQSDRDGKDIGHLVEVSLFLPIGNS